MVLHTGRWEEAMRWSRFVLVGLIAALVVAPSFAQDCPTLVGFADTPWCCAYDVAVAGNYAYVANGGQGLRVIDVSNPSSPVEVGFYDTTGTAWAVAVFARHAFVADGWEGLRVIDVSTPSNPIEVGFLGTPEYCSGSVTVSGSHLYLASGTLRVIDVSTPSNPIEVGFIDPLLGGASAVVVSGSNAYTVGGAWTGGLSVIDVSTPENPVEVGSLHIRVAYGVDVSGSYAYISSADGLSVIDVATPANPRRVAFFETPDHARDVAISGSHAFVVHDSYPVHPNGLLVIDVSDPSSPIEVGDYDLKYAHSVTVNGRYLYVASAHNMGKKSLNILSPVGCPGFVPQPPAPRRLSGRVRP
jgi:hypothetical protein